MRSERLVLMGFLAVSSLGQSHPSITERWRLRELGWNSRRTGSLSRTDSCRRRVKKECWWQFSFGARLCSHKKAQDECISRSHNADTDRCVIVSGKYRIFVSSIRAKIASLLGGRVASGVSWQRGGVRSVLELYL
jgi:hypothetical protein